jgi:hypothetical protein
MPKERQLDLDFVRVSLDARLRTDTVGEGKFASQATFVLVDADNTSGEGAYITLAGDLADRSGNVVGELRPQSLWIPPGETRTFALIDRDNTVRPTAAAAHLKVRGASIPVKPPIARVDNLRETQDQGRIVVQGMLRNDAARPAAILVIASFHDADGRPMTRPFSLIHLGANESQGVQFVGPTGSKRGTIFTGDAVY